MGAYGSEMKIGDRVRHTEKGWIGKIVGFMKRNSGVLVDLSDKQGIKVRWFHKDVLEVIKDDDT